VKKYAPLTQVPGGEEHLQRKGKIGSEVEALAEEVRKVSEAPPETHRSKALTK
jgi:hypothetical protein